MKENWENNWKDYYQILQVHPSAEPEVVKAAYDKLARKYHPDFNKASSALQRMGKANPAARIRVRSIATPNIFDTSNNNFIIVGPYYKTFPGGYCTWYAAKAFDLVAPSPGVNWSGDAQSWYSNASTQGWSVTTDPKGAQVGAIIVWKGLTYGHVAIVRQVSSTQIFIDEMNYSGSFVNKSKGITTNFGKVASATLDLSNLKRGSLSFVGYILPSRR